MSHKHTDRDQLTNGKGTEKHTLKEESALKILTELKVAALKIQYPNVPECARPRPSFSDKTSNGLAKCIIVWCQIKNQQAERVSVTGRVIDGRKLVTDGIGRQKMIGSITRIKSSMQKGSADISATIFGRSVKVEIKIGRDKQSEAQKEYQRQIEAAKGVYIIADCFQTFYDWFIEFGKEEVNYKP